jgi:hypothetical protein
MRVCIRKSRPSAAAYQAGNSGLPLRELLLGLREFGDVVGGILEGEKLTAVRQRYRIFERDGPGHVHKRSLMAHTKKPRTMPGLKFARDRN